MPNNYPKNSVEHQRAAIQLAHSTVLRIFIHHAEDNHGNAQERLANVLWLWDHGLEHFVYLSCPDCFFIYRWLNRFDRSSVQFPERR
jgi:hypothetical protein